MKSSNLLSNISNKFLLKGIFSYFPEKDKKSILNIFKYNKKFRGELNISLYNYQKEFLNLTFNGINPREYEINSLYDAFKDIFDNKEIFIKIINELFPEEEDDTKIFSDIEDNFKFTKIKEISNFNKIENLTSLEFRDVKNLDLGQMNARIKNLKISGEWNEKIKVKFSLLNNLEALILYGNSKLDIYDLPNNKNDIYELRNLKYLYLSQLELSEKLNIKVTIPNLIYFYLSFDEDSPIDDYDYDPFTEKREDKIKDTPFECDIDYFLEFTNLKYLHLYFKKLESNHGEGQSKTFICKKLENDIFKCHYIYIDDFNRNYIQEELFYYNQKMHQKYNIKLNVSLDDPENWNVFDFDKDYNNYEEFKFENIYNPLFKTNIKTNNFSVKKIDISLDDDDNEDNIIIKGIKHFINNIKKFLSLKEINISISSNLGYLFDSKKLNKLIKNLSTLKSLNIIDIKIYNSKIKVTEISSKSFEKMKIKKEDDYISIFYVNFLNRIKSKK